MYVEQRQYTFHSGKMPLWMDAYQNLGGPASARHMGPLLGFFQVEVGTINRVVFFRGWD
ncbi:MAG: NIPSNAP family protein, partial [Alphaproteobacteria bacterium]